MIIVLITFIIPIIVILMILMIIPIIVIFIIIYTYHSEDPSRNLNWQAEPEGVNMHEELPNSPPKTPGSVAQSSCSSPIYYDNQSNNRSSINNNFTADELLDRMLMGK